MKKISAIIICLLMFLTCTLTGCAGFSVNRVKYYNEVVATVGTTQITRFDLLNAYNGNSSYYSQTGMSESEAMQEVLDLLIDREALYQYTLNYTPEGNIGANPYVPTTRQINDIIQSIFDSVDSQIDEYIVTAKHILDIEVESAEEETETDVFKREDYQYKKRAELYKDGDKLVIVYKTEDTESQPFTALIDEDVLENYDPKKPGSAAERAIVEEIKNAYLEHLMNRLDEDEKENASALYSEILKQISRSLINYEFYLRDAKGNPYSKDTNGLLYRYFERMFKDQIIAQFLTNYQEVYLKNENLSLDKLRERYENISKHYYNRYFEHSADYKADMKNTGTEFEQVFYHLNIDEDAQFGYFLHTLFQFSDDQKAQIDNLKSKYGGKSFQEYAKDYREKMEDDKLQDAAREKLTKEFDAYKSAYTDIVMKTEVVFRENGKEVSSPANNSLREVLESREYQNLAKKHDMYEFVDFMFEHTQDTATLTADAPYVVGSFDESKGETYSTNSSMEEAFTMEAIKLMQAGENNSISNVYSANGSLDVENLCITSYGVHILYYICPVGENDLPYNGNVYFDTVAEDPLNLYKSYMNPLSELKGKTYFDLLFDLVYPAGDTIFTSNSNYTEYRKSITASAREEYGVEIFKTRLKATKTNI